MKLERFSTERLLTNLPKEWIMPSLRISPDGKNVSYQIRKALGKAIKINEFTHPRYSEVTPVIFSPNSKHSIYAASQNDKQFIVVDGIYQNAYPFVYINTLAFLDDDTNIAYAVQRNDEKFSIFINGEEEGNYENIVRIAPVVDNNQNYTYLIEENNKQSIILNGKTINSFDTIENLELINSTKELKYIYSENGFQYLVVGSYKSEKHDMIHDFANTSDWSKFAYIVEDNFKWKVIVSDGSVSNLYDEIKSITLSEDGSNVAFSARIGLEWFVVINGVELKKYDGVGEIKFSPNGKRIAYKAMKYTKGFWKKKPTSCVVLDDKESLFYEGIGKTGFNFNSDSSRFAYSAIDKQHSFAIIDGRETIRYDGIGANTPFFSPESEHVVLVASVAKNLSVLIDEEPGNIYKSIVMRDGGGVHFSSKDAFHYISLVKEELYLIEEKINYME